MVEVLRLNIETFWKKLTSGLFYVNNFVYICLINKPPMNSQRRNQLENNLKGRVLVWMERRETPFSELETTWLSITDLSDRELQELHSQVVVWENTEGSFSTSDRTVNINFETR